MDAERQQLRSMNNKLRDNIEELRHSLEPKERAFDEMQQSLLEKEQMLVDMRIQFQDLEEKRLASVGELTVKHQKHSESLEMQLAEAMSEQNRAAETISSLQQSKLKEELRSMDRAQKREGVDMTYLKNVLLKLLETGEVEALLPLIAMLLKRSKSVNKPIQVIQTRPLAQLMMLQVVLFSRGFHLVDVIFQCEEGIPLSVTYDI